MRPLSSNTQVVLLLTAPLIVGRSGAEPDLLSVAEYNRLARFLRDHNRQPADLLGRNVEPILEECRSLCDPARLNQLLGRGFQLGQAVDHWAARAIWAIGRADPYYPPRLKARLKEAAPPVLYGCGDPSLLERGGLAVVGSRAVTDELIRYTENVGQLAAEAHRAIVSGGARGIDQAAMRGALAAGGCAVGVLADSLERAALARENREPVSEGRLTLLSPYDPAAGFNVGHAMQRNKLIYALADAALVVNSDFEKGGTWAGAVEQLDRLHLVPVFVRDGADAPKGNAALLRRGSTRWPEPRGGREFEDVLAAAVDRLPPEPQQETLSFVVREEVPAPVAPTAPPAKVQTTDPPTPAEPPARPSAAEQLFEAVREVLQRELVEPRTETEVADLLGLAKSQAKAWLARLVEEAVLEKLSKPVRYRVARAAERLL